MTQLKILVRVELIAFTVLAFSVYYFLYFLSFSQGVFVGDGAAINIIKLLSILFLVGAFFTFKIRLNYFDLKYIFFVVVSAASYLMGSLFYGINDTLFMNYLLFSFLYPFLVSKGAEEKIIYSYNVICFVMLIQIFVDVFLNLKQIALWEGGLYVGGLGNPTSFGFVSTFCLAYIALGDVGFSARSKALLVIIYMYAVLNTSALFPILLSAGVLIVSLLKTGSFKKKIILIFSAASGIVLFLFITGFKGNLLKNKVDALLYYLGFVDYQAESLSVSVRVENLNLVMKVFQEAGMELFFGHYQKLAYHPVDSQYIALFLSFGVIVLLYFLFFNFLAACRLYLNKRRENRTFIFFGLLLFLLVFSNNRVLDYFPLGYIYVSLIALISRRRYPISTLPRRSQQIAF